MNPLLLVDSYKTEHFRQFPENMTLLYSNFTPRKSRIAGVDHVVFFGLQHFCLEYLIKAFNEQFFKEKELETFMGDISKIKDPIIKEYSKHINVDTKHIEALWDLGYLPIEIKAVPEGTLVPIGVPCFTIKNTHPDFAWLTNYLETLISCMMWQPITSATIAYEYKKLLSKYALATTGSAEFVQWQGHDFSMRGMSSVESAILSGMGHLLSFTGTDTIPAIYQLENSYKAEGLIGASVPATEHSVMCMGTKESEVETFKRLLTLYPTGILSIVSDTWDLWKVLTEYLPAIKSEILARDGKLVIRPDSGNPVDIICGAHLSKEDNRFGSSPEGKGVIELLWDIFGGTYVKGNDGKEYKQLDSHIGAIYGDGMGLHNLDSMLSRLKAKGFATTNLVIGFGSYGYQMNSRDTFGHAMKATYGEITHSDGTIEAREIFKDPITDDGVKRSKKGLLRIDTYDREGKQIYVEDQCTWEEEQGGILQTIFKNGVLVKTTTLAEIRERLK